MKKERLPIGEPSFIYLIRSTERFRKRSRKLSLDKFYAALQELIERFAL